jgi:hypothetical protein
MTYQVKNRFQNLPFKCNLHRYSTELEVEVRPALPGGVRLVTGCHKLTNVF